MATNHDTEVDQISNSGMGIGERNSTIENEFDQFVMPDTDERRPFSFVNRPRPSMYPLPIPEEQPDPIPLLALRRQQAVVPHRVSI